MYIIRKSTAVGKIIIETASDINCRIFTHNNMIKAKMRYIYVIICLYLCRSNALSDFEGKETDSIS